MVRRRGGLSGEDQSLERGGCSFSTVDGSNSCSIGVCHVGYFNQSPVTVDVNTKSEATLLCILPLIMPILRGQLEASVFHFCKALRDAQVGQIQVISLVVYSVTRAATSPS